MKGKNKKTLTPMLRFPEFKDPWQPATIGDLFDSEDDREKAAAFESDKILTVKLHANGVVRNERTGALTGGASYFKRRAGQFIFSKIDLLNGAFGLVPEELDGFYSSSDVPAFSFGGKHSPAFFINWLTANYRRLEIERTGTSATLKRVSPEKFRALPILLPSPAEQRKIAACLTSFDELLAAEGRKLEALRVHKKGLMQQLFPREGQSRPRLRLPEFRNAKEWQRTKLSDLLFETKRRNRDLTYGPDAVLSVSGEYGCVNQIELLGRSYAGISVKDYKVVETNNLVYTKSPLKKNPFGIFKVNKGKAGIVSTLYAVYGAKSSCHAPFIDYYFGNDSRLNSYLEPLVRKGPKNDMKVNNDVVLTGNIDSPEPAEQQRIAVCLSSLDALIVAASRKLDGLRAHKRGLMQQLFPSPSPEGL